MSHTHSAQAARSGDGPDKDAASVVCRTQAGQMQDDSEQCETNRDCASHVNPDRTILSLRVSRIRVAKTVMPSFKTTQ